MTDPIIILTTSAIADLAFREFIKSGAGEVAKKFSAGAIAKMNELRKMIVHKLQGKNEKLDTALTGAEKGDVKPAFLTKSTIANLRSLTEYGF
jgi:hypothetical protein